MSLISKGINYIFKAPKVVKTATGGIAKSTCSIFPNVGIQQHIQAVTSGTSQAVSQVTRPGLEEIVVKARIMEKGGIITHDGARISYPGAVQALYPDAPHVVVRGKVFYYKDKIGPNGCAVRHEVTRLSNGDIEIKFFDKNNEWVDSVETIKYNPKTKPITDKNEIAKIMLEEAGKTPPKPATILPEITEPHFQGFKKPKGTSSCARITATDGTSTVTFRDKDGNLLREIKCDKSGYPVEYTNYERSFENINGYISYGPNGETLPIPGRCQYDEVVRKSTYRINDSEVLSTTQIREVTPHNHAYTGKPIITTVDRRGRFEEVTIKCGDKKINEFFFTPGATSKVRLVADNAKGLTKEEIKLIQSDPYLSSRYYNDGVEFIESIKPTIFGEEGIRNPEFTRFTFEPPVKKGEGGCYYPKPIGWGKTERLGGRINVIPANVNSTNKAHTVNVVAHETRHGHQFDIMEDGINGKLVGEEKKFADELQDACDNYVDPEVDHDGYWKNKMEVDARQAGEKAKQTFDQHGEIQRKIFTA